ncbi:MAG: phenylalanine--tRNA ligase subunit beta [Acidobacteriaceae bacterium]|nr:phenylalanine--tRNA ligase subunit beta [Acidobacteriaceae bacterium]
MKFSYQWICELVEGLDVEPSALESLITVKTAECEGIEPFGAHFSRVTAVRVLDVQPLGKGKNKLVKIDAGGGKTGSVVCGASNVRTGMTAAWVPPGTSLGDRVISTAVIDGVESEGMLASAAELDLSRDGTGLLEVENVTPGALLPLKPDWILEIDNKSLTHRPDLWGHLGIAREVAAITHHSLLDPVKLDILPGGNAPWAVEIADHSLCPRYSALVLENVQVAPSPLPTQARLESIGLNPISNIVDITNYVLAELPQPMHAFDADKLTGRAIYVRQARAGERLKALNGETYDLHPEDLVIADEAGPVALAGVIGGADTAISETTTRVVLESANFQAASVRFTSARHKLRTDASMRFEKSLDPENTLRGLARVFQLIQEVSPGVHAVGGVADNRASLQGTKPILLPINFVSRKLGTEVSRETICEILHALGFATAETTPGILTVTVPSWRATKDISLKDDLVEEIGRMIGYDQITPQAPLVASVVPPANPMRAYLRQVRSQLTAQGFTEAYNYSFISEEEAARFGFDVQKLLAVSNPIAAEMTHLRPSLLPGIFKNIVSNVRSYHEFRIFEIGMEIHPNAGQSLPDEVPRAVAALYNMPGDEQDFFEAKRVLECVLPSACLRTAEARPYEHPARTGEILWHDVPLGRLFELHPFLLKEEGIEGRAVLFDIDLRTAQEIHAAHTVRYTPLRKYPTSPFDLSVLTASKTPVADIQSALRSLAGSDLALIEFVRQYEGPPLPQGQKSVTYHLEIGAADHTVTAEEVTAVRNRIMDGMRQQSYDFRA